ncbi:MAG: hypothetical protein OJF49_001925 [Ktedonobacterales bacterium]|nr:MAG: hypothetical protein OJF49_001925 [Ktedonobacterales bacterium]
MKFQLELLKICAPATGYTAHQKVAIGSRWISGYLCDPVQQS